MEKFVITCSNISTLYFLSFHLHMIKTITLNIFIWYARWLKLFLKQRATRNLAVSITYREWLGRHCGLLLSLAHPLKPMRPQDPCAAVDPPSPPFCSRKGCSWLGWEEKQWISYGLIALKPCFGLYAKQKQ